MYIYIYIYIHVCICVYVCIYIHTYIRYNLSSKHRGPNPNNNSLIRNQCCKRIVESLVHRCFLSYQGIVLRVGVPLFASDNVFNKCV